MESYNCRFEWVPKTPRTSTDMQGRVTSAADMQNTHQTKTTYLTAAKEFKLTSQISPCIPRQPNPHPRSVKPKMASSLVTLQAILLVLGLSSCATTTAAPEPSSSSPSQPPPQPPCAAEQQAPPARNCTPPRTFEDTLRPFCFVPETASPQARQFLSQAAAGAMILLQGVYRLRCRTAAILCAIWRPMTHSNRCFSRLAACVAGALQNRGTKFNAASTGVL